MGGVSLTAQFIYQQAAGKDILITPHTFLKRLRGRTEKLESEVEEEDDGERERETTVCL